MLGKKDTTIGFCLAFVITIFLGTTSACGESSNKANILAPEVQNMADTMFARKRRMRKKILDSLCIIESPKLLIEVRDSIVQVEREQIKKIIGNE